MDTINVNEIVDAAQQGHWLIFAGMLLSLLVQVARKVVPLVKRIPKKYLPYIIAGIGVVAAGATVLAIGGGWLEALNSGVQAALSALGAYALAEGPGKALFGARQESAPPVEPPTEEPKEEPKDEEVKP
jgi:hypothetical protein